MTLYIGHCTTDLSGGQIVSSEEIQAFRDSLRRAFDYSFLIEPYSNLAANALRKWVKAEFKRQPATLADLTVARWTLIAALWTANRLASYEIKN